ncbi:unnamed protein product [Lota lota]
MRREESVDGGLLGLSCHVELLMAARSKEQSSSAADVTRTHRMGWERLLSGRVTDTSPDVPARSRLFPEMERPMRRY